MLWLYGWPGIVRSVMTLLVWFVGLGAFPDALPTLILERHEMRRHHKACAGGGCGTLASIPYSGA